MMLAPLLYTSGLAALLLAAEAHSLWHWKVLPPPPREALRGRSFDVIAHRGFSARYPENTLPAFRAAAQADCLELDVHLSADGRVVVVHDALLHRTTDGRGAVAAHAWEQLRRLDAGRWKGPEFAGTRLPLLEEVLDLLPPRQGLLVELKNDARNRPYAQLPRRVLDVAKAFPGARLVLQSFEPCYLEALGRWAPEVPTMRLLEWGGVLPWHLDASWRAGRLALAPTWRALNTDYRWLTPRRVADLARKGLACCPYTIDREPDMRRAVGMGAAGLITNEVGTALALKAALA